MINEIDNLYQYLKALPFPELGKQIGDFPLYDALLAGVANNYIQRRVLPDLDKIPCPDLETINEVNALRHKSDSKKGEVEFLQYFKVLEELQAVLETTAMRSD